MAPFKQTLRNLRWYQWLLSALVFFYLLYVALGYLYLPGKLQDVVQTDVASLIGRDIQVQRIAFNPFTLALEVQQFDIADRPQQPLLAWQRLYVNLDAWGSLFGWELRLSQLDLDAPRVNIERRAEDLNFSDILARFPAGETPEEPAEKTAFALRVDQIQINDGQFAFDDISGSKPARSVLDQITIGVQDLYLATGDDKLNPFSLQAQMPGGGSLALAGQYRADPLQVNSQVKLEAIHLPVFADFIENAVALRLNDGVLTLQAQVDIEQQQDALQLLVKQGALTIDRLALDDAQAEPALARIEQLSVSGIELDLLQQQVAIDSVVFDGLQTHQWLQDDGKLRFSHLLAEQAVAANQPVGAPDPASGAWTFVLAEYRLINSAIEFTDFSNGVNVTQQLRSLNANLKNISLVEGTQVPVELTATLNDGGQLQVQGTMVPVPFALDLRYQVQNLPLAPLSPYVELQSWLQLRQGTVSLDGSLQLQNADPLPLTLAMNLAVADAQARDTRTGKTILQWKNLGLQQLQLDLVQRQLTIDSVEWQQPEMAAEINTDKQLNLATLMKPVAPLQAAEPVSEPVSEPAATTAATDAPFNVSINRFSIQDGTTRFRDASVQPPYKTALNNLAFELTQLTSAGPQPARFSLTSKIDKYAPFNVKGTLAPLQQQPGFAFTSQLQGLDMQRLSPYTGTYIGYQLQSGTLALDLDYQLKQRHLTGKNAIVARQLYLGEEVASEQAMDVPVALGLALLRDTSGVIDLDVGVAGDLDDPGFSVSGIVLKALLNVLTKAATSPFQLLGSLVGGSEDLGALEFASGSSELTSDDQAKLTQLVQALSQRPQLAVDVRGNASAQADAAALQLQKVRDAIATSRKIAPAELALATLLDDDDNRDELDDLNAALELPDEDDREEALLTADPTLKGQDLTARIYQQMLEDVAARQTVSEQDLLALADQRALEIKQYLVETAGLDHARVRMVKARKTDLTGRICQLGLVPG